LKPDPSDLEASAWRIMESQRATPVIAEVNGQRYRPASGFATMSTVGREGIHTRLLGRWPDRVGDSVLMEAPVVDRSN
jgi:hypothetical protein